MYIMIGVYPGRDCHFNFYSTLLLLPSVICWLDYSKVFPKEHKSQNLYEECIQEGIVTSTFILHCFSYPVSYVGLIIQRSFQRSTSLKIYMRPYCSTLGILFDTTRPVFAGLSKGLRKKDPNLQNL